MVLITLMSAYLFCMAVECSQVHIIEPVPELVDYYTSFGFVMEKCGYIMSADTKALEETFLKFAQ